MRIKDICISKTDNYQKQDNWKYFNYLDTGNLIKNKIESFQYIKHVEDLPSRAKQKVTINDILYSSVRPNQEHYGFIDKEYNNLLVSTGFIILKPIINKVNPKYLYYYLTQKNIVDQLQTIAQNSTSSYPSITKDDILNLEINLPSLETQNKITSILSSIDCQIERNALMINKLQVLAQFIYSSWFIQFNFPNKDGKSYKSSGGKMVYNNEIKRDIPEGWEVKKLKDLMFKVNRPFDYSKDEKTIDLSVMPSNSFCLTDINNSKNFTTNLFLMKKGDILFGSIRPYLKKAGLAPCDGAVAGTVHCLNVYNEFDYNFCLLTLCSENMFNYANKASKGTKMPVISCDDLLEYPIIYNKEIIQKFQRLNLKEFIPHLIDENHKLTSFKNKLLPLLINGQLQ